MSQSTDTNADQKSAAQAQDSGWSTYRRLLGYVKEFWLAFVISLSGYALYGISQASLAALMQYLPAALGEPTPAAGFLSRFVDIQTSDDLHWLLPLMLVVIAVVRGLGSYLGGYYISLVGRNLVHRLRQQVFNRLQELPGLFFVQQGSSKLISLITFNVEQITTAGTDAIRTLVREGMTVVALLIYVFYLNWKLSLVFLIAAPFIGLVVGLASRLLRKYSQRIQDAMGGVTHVVTEAIRGFVEVKIFGGQTYERKRFDAASGYNLAQSLKLSRVNEISSPLVQILTYSAIALLFWIGLNTGVRSGMDTGLFLSYITAASMLARPLRQLTNVNAHIQRGIAAAQSIFKAIDEPAEIDRGTRSIGRASGGIEFRNLSFSYPGDTTSVLKNLNFMVEPGSTLALVGRSGSGKSTLASLISRLNPAPAGQIYLDDYPVEEYRLADLRRQIAIVSQNVVLFEDSIAANIAYGELSDASEQQIIDAAKAANAWDFIQELPSGLHTLIGENGTTLSGGQRQRLALARAFLKDAPILILDEATSALDNESERKIQVALKNIVQNRTTLIIAHRLSTIENADTILVLDEGRILEMGNHHDLISRNGAYAQLYKMQIP